MTDSVESPFPENKQLKMADDPVYGTIRAEICDQWIAAGQPEPKANWLYSRLVEAKHAQRYSTFELFKAFNDVTVLVEELNGGDFQSGGRMVLEELRERLGITLEIEEVPSNAEPH